MSMAGQHKGTEEETFLLIFDMIRSSICFRQSTSRTRHTCMKKHGQGTWDGGQKMLRWWNPFRQLQWCWARLCQRQQHTECDYFGPKKTDQSCCKQPSLATSSPSLLFRTSSSLIMSRQHQGTSPRRLLLHTTSQSYHVCVCPQLLAFPRAIHIGVGEMKCLKRANYGTRGHVDGRNHRWGRNGQLMGYRIGDTSEGGATERQRATRLGQRTLIASHTIKRTQSNIRGPRWKSD